MEPTTGSPSGEELPSKQNQISVPDFLRIRPLDDGGGGWLLGDQGGYYIDHEQALALLAEVSRGYMRARPDWIDDRNRETDERWHQKNEASEDSARRKRRERRPPMGYVYLFESQGRFKIGISRQLLERRAQLAKQSPYPVTSIHHVHASDYRALEKELHRKYDNHRMFGEWFDLPEDAVRGVIADMDAWAREHDGWSDVSGSDGA